MILKKSWLYLSCLFFFKISVGAILLVTGWDSLGISGNGLENITIIMALSFIPAAFAKSLFKIFKNITLPKILTFSLWITSVLIIVEHLLMGVTQLSLFIVHFTLWIFIFVIEVATEKWYVTLSQDFNLNEVRKLSGVSTSIGQIGVIIGPATVMLSKQYSQALPYFIILASFLVASLFAAGAHFKQNDTLNNSFILLSKAQSKKTIKWLYILGFSLIWPTLTVFNLSIPVLAKTKFNSIDVAGFLEILIALSTAIAGFFHPYVTRNKSFNQRALTVFIVLFISATTSFLFSKSVSIVATGIFLLGLSYGYLRVELRAHLSKRFSPTDAGEIIASANSWSALFVVIYAGIFYLLAQLQADKGLTVIFPLSFILSATIFTYILHLEDNQQNGVAHAK